MTDSSKKKSGQSLQRMKWLVQLMNENNLTELELEEEGFKVRMAKTAPVIRYAQDVPAIINGPALASSTPAKVAENGNDTHKDDMAGLIAIKSPIVGTFYRAPAPDAKPYVQIGARVENETVVCIIEAMKVMNELKAECRGTIVKVGVENAQTVEYGQILFYVKPD